MINALLKAMELKDEKRSGQELYNIEEPDSIAEHSWSVSFLTLVHAEDGINLEKALKMAIIHDLGETEVGDIPQRADEENQETVSGGKEKQERKAIADISGSLYEREILDLWNEYEERKTQEAQFVKDMDMLESCLQALRKEKEGMYNPEDNKDLPYDNLDEFFLTSEGEFNTEKGEQLFRQIKSRYEETKE